MKDRFEILKWDSDFFNFKVAKINTFDSKEVYQDILEDLKRQNIKLAYCFTTPGSFMDKILEVDSAILVDQKVTYSRPINRENNEVSDVNILAYSKGIVTDKMVDIAIQTSEHSRFRVDVNFQNEEFKKLYYQWIKNAVEDIHGGQLFTYQEVETLKGLIYLKEINHKIGIISLIGVDKEARGEQIGTKLINQSMAYFNKLGKKEVQVVTQKANVLACNFYEKNGFEIIDTVNVYHLWIF